jgi:dolichol-phosphate mannosyltransferase
LKINCREFTTSYRGFNLKKLKNFDLKEVKVKGYSFFMETIYLLEKNNFKICEIPINFRNRKFGKSKIPTFEIIRTLLRLINLSFNKYRLSIKK